MAVTLPVSILALDEDSAESALVSVARRLPQPIAAVRSLDPELAAALRACAESEAPLTHDATLAQLALLVAADDPAHMPRVADAVAEVQERPARAFAPPDPITVTAVITSALVVLSTHVELKYEKKRWSCNIVKKPSDPRILDALLRAICRATESYLSKRDDDQGP